MSLLQNEEFVLYQLRTAYLLNIKDGVGERLINVNSAVLNNPSFRGAGWSANPTDIKRTYSPPIPTAIASDYFQAPPRSAGLVPGAGFGDDEEEGGLVTGGVGSNDTVGPAPNTRRRRRKEHFDEDDSSDLSDESDDDADTRPAHQIKFSKMPVRTRAGSSPIQSTMKDGPAVLVTSPSRPPDAHGLRRGSLGAIETMTHSRARSGTVTSSEFSSENELDPSLFQRKQINSRKAAKSSHLLTERIQEDEREGDADMGDNDPGAQSDDSTLSSDFEGTVGSGSLLGEVGDGMTSSPPTNLSNIPPMFNTSPKKSKQPPAVLQALPPPRPISQLPPVSTLTAALKARNKKPTNPLDRFATLSGKGDPNPLYIKIYTPFSKQPTKPCELLLKRTANGGNKVVVADAIGLALYRYGEEGIEPALDSKQTNVNRWTMRMVEDEEVDMDFPALVRTKPISDFTSNNNRGARPRARDKPWDEFAIVEASEAEYEGNKALTPTYEAETLTLDEDDEDPMSSISPAQPPQPIKLQQSLPPRTGANSNPIIGPNFAFRKDNSAPLDQPATQNTHATPRTGAMKTLTVHFTDSEFNSRTTTMEVTADTYLAEIFDQACKRLHVDKGAYVLKVHGTSTVAPPDRTVEALGDRLALDLSRKRFMGDGAFGLSGSPASSSPNAPLLISSTGTPKKTRKGLGVWHPLAQRNDTFLSASTTYKRYAVTRKQPMSFASSSARILALDGEYMHIMPSESNKNLYSGNIGNKTGPLEPNPGKTTTVHFRDVVGSKVSRRHPRMFRVVVFKERETKRYDFEAQSATEASEIVREVRKGMERFQDGVL
ncbi:hypothetical protein M501DRAFT_959526 [Patellaria atrata CBS 101060]|uniref:Uncharacterized protein n=1 Tax=Patellaria atrata CBS 101060 TaxID=1346257 RepID=A0A9P4S6V4_9PEZI|nr:hypothetical protein M501DRAFT_959526 [Patellaria atrata CBS 101060]